MDHPLAVQAEGCRSKITLHLRLKPICITKQLAKKLTSDQCQARAMHAMPIPASSFALQCTPTATGDGLPMPALTCHMRAQQKHVVADWLLYG